MTKIYYTYSLLIVFVFVYLFAMDLQDDKRFMKCKKIWAISWKYRWVAGGLVSCYFDALNTYTYRREIYW